MNGQTIYLNCGEAATYSITIYNKVNGVAAVADLGEKEVHFYIKRNEQDLDEEAFIHKSIGSGIELSGDGSTGTCLVHILPEDTASLLTRNVTIEFRWSLRLVDGTSPIHISEGVFVVTPQ